MNGEATRSLVVDRIPLLKKGLVGIWVGFKSKGEFKNLVIKPNAGKNYGFNASVGKYFVVAPDTKLYYEVYGEGEPVLMLHGGVFGYIDEYEYFIDELSRDYQVLCLATRGHVKSDIGHEPYTYQQRAEDVIKFLDYLGVDSCAVIGFSDGGFSPYKLRALYPERVKKMVVIGAGDLPEGSNQFFNYNSKELIDNYKDHFEKRLAVMPEPHRWDESLQMLNDLYSHDFVSKETYAKIKCPVLLLAGENDSGSTPENLLKTSQYLAKVQLSIIPGCGHVVFYCNWPAVWGAIEAFISE